MKKISKLFHRIRCIIFLKKGIYGKYGKKCIFKKNVFFDEKTNVGNYTYIGDNTMITDAKIGNYCSIAPNVMIGLGEHDVNEISTSFRLVKAYQDSNKVKSLTEKKITIGNDVWIGTHAVIKRGVNVGNGAIIGAGAVVTKNVPDFSIVVGVPAKIIKYRFSSEFRLKIKKSNWWDYDINIAAKKIKKLKEENRT
ncbi:CatB-related O-acetyltransferase [Pisciglobus halotolerans]|uniref:Acetyltransferase (Isoleucine patch superfamily) n=1 Tax=Pisciglobus halotolerans TaxID=745365 RepID=A0A1I3DKU3_9LACT|nr:CatB-related O-acetyltransferase [Pisciglobus halotolerans]SFH87293.1 Acetyltransferase (isoleucine patch superfamily) [Pisciglobus halotolerans]